MPRAATFLISALTALSASHALAQGSCGPSLLGEPCSQGGVAVAGPAEFGLSLGVGNPIHLITGNKYQKELDLPSSVAAPGLEIMRHYNALDRRPSLLGPGWSLSYDTRLFSASGRWQIVQADGSRVVFNAAHGHPIPNARGSLSRRDKEWLWVWPTGRKLWFDAGGFLVRIQADDGTRLDIRRHRTAGPLANAIESVIAGNGHALQFGYRVDGAAAFLNYIDTPLGRFQYEQETVVAPGEAASSTPRLKTLTRPDGMQRRYLYESERQAGNTHALTGIEITSADGQQTERLNTWAYDAESRATLSIRGEPDSTRQRLAIHYERPATPQVNGMTVVTQPGKQTTQFEFALKGSRHVLTAVRGASCPGCAASGNHAAYDEQGRLQEINGTLIQRDAKGQVQALRPLAAGWPGLLLNYQSNGYRASWHSTLTGNEHMQYDGGQRPRQRLFANGDTVTYRYNAAGRPVELHERNAKASTVTTLSWQGDLLTHVSHPHERETRHYDSHNRLTRRAVERPATQTDAGLRYSEAFSYDQQHRLVRHQLPEGGSLHYRWSGQRVVAISWHDAKGTVHPVIDTVPGRGGYRYGNGLHLETALNDSGQLSRLALTRNLGPDAPLSRDPIWLMQLDYDKHGNLRQEQHDVPMAGIAQTWRYAYDQQSRLIGAQSDSKKNHLSVTDGATEETFWYAWNEDGSQAARRVNGVTTRASITRDASGLPLTVGDKTLLYGPSRRLTGVQRQGVALAAWQHNAFGHRIASRHENTRTDYFFLDNKVVAESHHEAVATGTSGIIDAQEQRISRRYIYAHHVVVGMIAYTPDTPEPARKSGTIPAQLPREADRAAARTPPLLATLPGGTLYFVHADSVGAPRLVTDAGQALRWLAHYTPTGTATRILGDLTVDLRLPGQVYDRITGWHDNLLRTYAPDMGQYLEPDPLGPIPGNQALGYAGQQPRRHVDPLGLLLFAFDGTRNGPQTQSNVWKMSQYYQDGPVYYHSGPGSPLYLDSDALTAWRAKKIIETQWLSLLNALDRLGSLHEPIAIDIIGFSRGAALARHFGNVINQHIDRGLFSYTDSVRGLVTACVDLRFMGLFDTVAQFGVAGSQNSNYDLSIASAWQWVAHAVALHERRWLFPLTSVGEGPHSNTIEAPFIGAHADIGGGVALNDKGEPKSQGDLSDVALNWMIWQARAAALQFGTLDEKDREVLDPILHDQRPAVQRYIQNGDRSVDAPNGSRLLVYQDDHARLGREQRSTTEALINRRENWLSSASHEVADVDMNGYAQWLHEELGWQALPA